ncbi:helix-turn-helix domain-containing protein [Clostridium felsineum]|uniref:helix-turn-helix domain-containing protein n=1 Tax=Clostridium felsineum TaxID=36839 RepID=UPI00214D8DE4|nr:helix-turn-helix transcriptional regulator [Clostridium felsineum]MCR3758135.1 helix-turn-helix domain-containing protein [Clostridium felsineum]
MTTNILPVGVKIKKLREKYQLNQDDIVGTELTRNLISQIEHGKANLTKSTAELIIRNTKEILDRRMMKLDPKWSVDYLLETEESQAGAVLTTYIKELKELSVYQNSRNFLDCLEKIETLLSQWEFGDLKIEVCEIAGDYYTNRNEYLKAYIYYENVKYLIACQTDMNKVASIFRKLSTVYCYTGNFAEGIRICKYALSRFDMEESYKCVFNFNMSLYLNYSGQYEQALEVLTGYEDKFKEVCADRYDKVLLLKASCLHGAKHYAAALDVYNHLVKTHIDDVGTLCIYYNNMAEIYFNTGKRDFAVNYINTVIQSLPKISEDFRDLPSIYFELGKLCKMMAQHNNGLSYLNKALELAKSFKYYSATKEILNEFTQFDTSELPIDLLKEFTLLTEIIGIADSKLAYNVIQYYGKINDVSTVCKVCDYCKSKSNKIKGCV